MKDIVSILFFLGICVLPTIIKAVKEAKNPQPIKGKQERKTPPPFQFEREAAAGDNDAEMRKKRPKVPKEQEYFTYETQTDDSPEMRVAVENEEKTDMQSAENEKERKPEMTLSEEEIYLGIIYSEILKRKFN